MILTVYIAITIIDACENVIRNRIVMVALHLIERFMILFPFRYDVVITY